MNRHLVRTTLAAAVTAVAAASPTAAQLRVPPVTLVVGAGAAGRSELGPIGAGGVHEWGQHQPGAALQLGVEAASPLRGVDLRLGYQFSNPQLALGDANHPENPPQNVYRTGVGTLTLDAVVRLPRVLDARPYLLAGAGLRHYDYNQTSFDSQPVRPEDKLEAGLHLGGGLAWNVGRYDLFVEGSGFFSRFGAPQPTDTKFGGVRDANLGAGVRIPLHR
ncbi:MAG TPA: hypothetical protein VF092_18275 [Longimicrobium sp.]